MLQCAHFAMSSIDLYNIRRLINNFGIFFFHRSDEIADEKKKPKNIFHDYSMLLAEEELIQ